MNTPQPTPEVPKDPEVLRREQRTKIMKDGIASMRAALVAAGFEQDIIEIHTYLTQQITTDKGPVRQVATTIVDDAPPMQIGERVSLACVALQSTIASFVFPVLPSAEARNEVRKLVILNLSGFVGLEGGPSLVLPGQIPPPMPPMPGRDGMGPGPGLMGPFGRMGPGPRRIK